MDGFAKGSIPAFDPYCWTDPSSIKIKDATIENMLSWHHSGFHVYVGNKIWPDDEAGLENLAKYIVRACFSQERMIYIPVEKSSDGAAKVIYTSKDGRSRKTFDALDWLAQLVTHIPARYEQTVGYYGYYSKKSRGLRKKAHADNQLPTIIAGERSSKEFRRNWARLIRKICLFLIDSKAQCDVIYYVASAMRKSVLSSMRCLRSH